MNKKLLFAFLGSMLVGLAVAYYFVNSVYGSNVDLPEDSKEIFITKDMDYESILDMLENENIISSRKSFDFVAGLMDYDEGVKGGKYTINNGWSNRELIGVLRGGRQDPITVTFNNARTIDDLAGKLAPFFESDSTEILATFKDEENLRKHKVTPETAMTLFIPNSYETYWNTSPADFMAQMSKESLRFWGKENREQLLDKQGMTKEEVYTLASIVEKESNYKPERKTVAGVYLNRIKKGIPLQADPTVVFAMKKWDLRRVLNKHLEFDSPYNTYKNAGLPPGPIAMPSINSIDAVLNAENHDYLYFCARPGYDNGHLFARSLRQHNQNAATYHRWLRSEGIR